MASSDTGDTRGVEVDGLETRRVDTAAEALPRDEALFARHRPSETLGRYVLLRPLGAGGMSVVWLAFDPELDRKVALKLMHEGRGGVGVGGQRLLREAQALARLSHANVVHVYDVGIVGGEVYLAMELVDGTTLKDWLHAERRSPSAILQVLARAGAGLAAAHDAGLVHLDFKPTNIVVGHDGQVRVVDFGLARPPRETRSRTSDEFSPSRSGVRRLGERLTEDGSVLGTPGYIAPEVLSGRDADGRADQFSFCVTAWEALFGERPFEANEHGSLNRNVVAGRMRALPPAAGALPRAVRATLLRGLSTDPEQRFASMRELIAALLPPRRLRRWSWAAAAVAVTAAALLPFARRSAGALDDRCAEAAAGLESTWNPERRARVHAAFDATGAPFAADTWTTVAKVVELYAEQWAQQARDSCEATVVRAAQSRETHGLREACLQDAAAKLEELLTRFEQADATTVENAVTAAVGIGTPSSCADTETLHAEASLPEDPDERERAGELRHRSLRARVVADTGQARVAWAELKVAIDEARKLGHGPTLARVLQAAATVKGDLGEPDGAEVLLDEALVLAERAGLDRLRFLVYLDLSYVVGHQLRDARRGSYYADAAVAVHSRIRGAPEELSRLYVNRGILAAGLGEYQRALELFEEALARSPPDDPVLATLLLDIGGVQYESGNFDVALDYYERAYELQIAQVGPAHPLVALVLENRANARQALGDFDAALADHQRALAIHEGAGLTSGLTLALQLNNVGAALSGMQRYGEAVEYYERARAAMTDNQRGHPIAAVLLINIGEARLAQGAPAEALGLYRNAIAMLEVSLGRSHPYVGVALTGAGLAQLELGERAEARETLTRALAIHERGGDPVQLAETKLGLARVIFESGATAEFAQARTYAQQAREAFVAVGPRGAGPLQRADALLERLGP